jgi:hypothetical protein
LTQKSRPDYNNQELGTTKARSNLRVAAHKGKKDDHPRTRKTRQKCVKLRICSNHSSFLRAPWWLIIFIRIYGSSLELCSAEAHSVELFEEELATVINALGLKEVHILVQSCKVPGDFLGLR